jgi:hypothetical protein
MVLCVPNMELEAQSIKPGAPNIKLDGQSIKLDAPTIEQKA